MDLGCGQGRDAIPLARLGYTVVGVDISAVGIHQMLEIVHKEKLLVSGIVADMYNYHITDAYDIVLLDAILHFYKRDKEKERNLLQRIMKEIKSSGILCILINKSNKAEGILEDVFKKSHIGWDFIEDKYIDYPEKYSTYRMLIGKKQ